VEIKFIPIRLVYLKVPMIALLEGMPRRGFRIVESVIKTVQNPRRRFIDL